MKPGHSKINQTESNLASQIPRENFEEPTNKSIRIPNQYINPKQKEMRGYENGSSRSPTPTNAKTQSIPSSHYNIAKPKNPSNEDLNHYQLPFNSSINSNSNNHNSINHNNSNTHYPSQNTNPHNQINNYVNPNQSLSINNHNNSSINIDPNEPKPMVVMEINIAQGRVTKINIYEDSDPFEIADLIVEQYGLNADLKETIANNIEKYVENFLNTHQQNIEKPRPQIKQPQPAQQNNNSNTYNQLVLQPSNSSQDSKMNPKTPQRTLTRVNTTRDNLNPQKSKSPVRQAENITPQGVNVKGSLNLPGGLNRYNSSSVLKPAIVYQKPSEPLKTQPDQYDDGNDTQQETDAVFDRLHQRGMDLKKQKEKEIQMKKDQEQRQTRADPNLTFKPTINQRDVQGPGSTKKPNSPPREMFSFGVKRPNEKSPSGSHNNVRQPEIKEFNLYNPVPVKKPEIIRPAQQNKGGLQKSQSTVSFNPNGAGVNENHPLNLLHNLKQGKLDEPQSNVEINKHREGFLEIENKFYLENQKNLNTSNQKRSGKKIFDEINHINVNDLLPLPILNESPQKIQPKTNEANPIEIKQNLTYNHPPHLINPSINNINTQNPTPRGINGLISSFQKPDTQEYRRIEIPNGIERSPEQNTNIPSFKIPSNDQPPTRNSHIMQVANLMNHNQPFNNNQESKSPPISQRGGVSFGNGNKNMHKQSPDSLVKNQPTEKPKFSHVPPLSPFQNVQQNFVNDFNDKAFKNEISGEDYNILLTIFCLVDGNHDGIITESDASYKEISNEDIINIVTDILVRGLNNSPNAQLTFQDFLQTAADLGIINKLVKVTKNNIKNKFKSQNIKNSFLQFQMSGFYFKLKRIPVVERQNVAFLIK